METEQMKRWKVMLSLPVMLAVTSWAQAANYPGLVISRIWVSGTTVAVYFDSALSAPSSVAACPAAYVPGGTDYKPILAVLLSAKTTGSPVTLYEGPGGTTLPSIVDASVPNVWARPIAFVSLDP
jgi:hypothetical protein